MNELVPTEIEEQGGRPGMDWDDFRVFVEVVKVGSFNRAASKLHMTQPTVSRRLMRLEEAIGARLFDRDRRGPRLTVEGQRIYDDAIAAQTALLRAASQASNADFRIEGGCKIQMGDGVATYWMPLFLKSFFSRHPNIEIKLFGVHDPATNKRELVDLAVHYFVPRDNANVTVRLGTMHFVPCASRDYLRLHGTPTDLKSLAKHKLLDQALYRADIGSSASWLPDDKAGALLVSNLSAILGAAVRQGVGIAMLPTYVAVTDPNYVMLDVGIYHQAPMYISYDREAAKKWPVRMTLDFLRSCVFDVKNMPWFQEDYIPPAPDWADIMSMLVERAALPLRGGRSSLRDD